jgi:hypothetical protein
MMVMVMKMKKGNDYEEEKDNENYTHNMGKIMIKEVPMREVSVRAALFKISVTFVTPTVSIQQEKQFTQLGSSELSGNVVIFNVPRLFSFQTSISSVLMYFL